MNIKKASWGITGNSLRLSMPIVKIDQATRTVSGYATMDNIDRQGDVVLADASTEAFSEFAGNIREMHQPIAVGRMLNYEQDYYFDQESGQMYNAIFVKTYVSEGAESTWLKVLDGTLTGFSIFGDILQSTVQYVPDLETSIRFIQKYILTELSLVDEPANQFARILSIQKSVDGAVLDGMVADTKIENVFWCPTDNIAIHSATDSETCKFCIADMTNIGWIEVIGDVAAKINGVLNSFNNINNSKVAIEKELGDNVNENDQQADSPAIEGGIEMADSEVTTELAADVEEVSSTEVVEKVETVVDDSDAVEKILKSFQEAIKSDIRVSNEEVLKSVVDKHDALKKEIDELRDSLNGLLTKFNSVDGNIAAVEKRIQTVENSSAIKKSGDLGGSTGKPNNKNIGWDNAFFGARR